MKLVIVESPAKARTIGGFLGREYVVESSIGHVRDLPRSAADVPATYKQEGWARLGVDTDNDFKPLYIIPKDKKSQITKLKKLLKEADELFLATDEDREGESIAWHLHEVLNPRVPVRRMVFHEITPGAIRAALDEPRDLDRRLVDAQEARRILDRLFGYEVSPVLWKMVRPKLSAGRVQSPAVRIVVQRERERMAFVSASYWDLDGSFVTTDGEEFSATLVSVDGAKVASGKDFASTGDKTGDALALDEAAARALVADLDGRPADVRSMDTKPYTRKPYPPFRTSTLQQEAGRKLRFASARTMRAAQRLYENGYITYMRTDSVSLSETAIAAARTLIESRYGADHLPGAPRVYTSKVKNAQEAHEAIRPSGDSFKDPEQVARELGPRTDEARLYDLVWKRTVASQMENARGESVAVRVGAVTTSGRETVFATSGKVIHFAGFLRAYVEGSDDPDAELEDQERRLPAIAEGDDLAIAAVGAVGHETKPPARFTEASLVKRLEELGIGRPSTYASIIQTIQDRGYVWKRGTGLIPSFTAFSTVTLLEQHFPQLIDFDFTARMEDDLDGIANGVREAVPWLSDFYFGNGHIGLKKAVSEGLGDIDARAINSIPIGMSQDGVPIVARVGRFGPYLERGEDRASIPEDLPPDELSIDRAVELLNAPSDERVLGTDPDTGFEIVAKPGRFGPYIQLGTADDYAKKDKPKTASLFKSMDLDSIELEQALKLLALPRDVGVDPETGEMITSLNGRYGPYLKRGTDTRSLEAEEQIFTVTVAEAVTLFVQPKRGRGRAAPKAPLRDVGVDPATGWGIEVRDGRFGPYVTDGGENASLRKEHTVETITVEQAVELLAARRDRMEAQGKKPKPGKTREPAAE